MLCPHHFIGKSINWYTIRPLAPNRSYNIILGWHKPPFSLLVTRIFSANQPIEFCSQFLAPIYLSFLFNFRYIATGDSFGSVKFFDRELKLSNWYVLLFWIFLHQGSLPKDARHSLVPWLTCKGIQPREPSYRRESFS